MWPSLNQNLSLRTKFRQNLMIPGRDIAINHFQNGGRPPSWISRILKIFNIFNFWYVIAQLCSGTGQLTKLTIFENSRWRTAAILKIVSSLYLGRESSDFDEIWYADSNFGSRTVRCWFIKKLWNSKWRTAAILKIVFWLYLHELVIVRLTRYLAGASRTMLRHTPHDENSNFRKFKVADGRHFENGFITISQPRVIRFQWNIVCHCRFWF